MGKKDDDYRRVITNEGSYLIDKKIPVVRSIPKNPQIFQTNLEKRLSKTESPAMGGYPNIAIPKSVLTPEKLEEMGFEGTRLHTRFPGEPISSKSYRAGRAHAHDYPGPYMLVHYDKEAPEGIIGTAKHVVTEGVPSLFWFDKEKLPIKKIEKTSSINFNSFCDEFLEIMGRR
jgi:hypothetical protein